MIAFISGKLVKKNPTNVILENSGIGFNISISLNTYRKLGTIGALTELLIHLHVREDLLQLFGFSCVEEKELFLKLISISGIGPKMAQVILSGMTAEEFIESILDEDVTNLTRISGIGKKTAQRLVFDLKERVSRDKKVAKGVASIKTDVESLPEDDAIMALISLGYSRQNAESAVKKAFLKYGISLSVEDLVKYSLIEI